MLARMEIRGAAAVVTGGASGLGAATARALAEAGALVVVADLDEAGGGAIAAEIGGAFARTDVTEPDDVIGAIDAAVGLGPLRILVNCAGIGIAIRTVGKDGEYASAHPLDVFTRVVTVNLIGSFNCIRLVATAMSRNEPAGPDGERGVIVNTASVAAYDGQIGQAAYSASKGGIVGMTLPIARDLAPVGIRVNTIAPGLIDTPIYGSGEGSDQFKDRLKQDVLFPDRFGFPTEYAALALELIRNSYMNAETVRIDAGARLRPK